MSNAFTTCRALLGLAVLAVLSASPLAPVGAQSRQFDPFEDRKPAKKTAPRPVREGEVPLPALSERLAKCSERAGAAGKSAAATPCPYLVSELRVTGVFTTGEGLGAFVEAAPTKQTFTLRKGDALFDGTVVSIRSDSTDGPAAVIFKQVTQMYRRGGVRPVEQTITVPVASAAPGQ